MREAESGDLDGETTYRCHASATSCHCDTLSPLGSTAPGGEVRRAPAEYAPTPHIA